MRLRITLYFATSVIFTVGCGGGGDASTPTDDASTDTAQPDTAPVDTAQPDTAPVDTGADAADTTPACVDPIKDCPAPTTACAPSVCTESATCGTTKAAAGTACTDSAGKVCDGNGSCVACLAATDCPASTTTCATPTCNAHACGADFAALGTACSDHGGAVCNGTGSCVAMHCMDGVKDADETDKDCGGSCPACAVGLACKVTADCATGNACATNVCTAISCTANAPTNGTVNAGTAAATVAYGASATYACKTGYALKGTAPTCGGTAIPGTLSGAEPTCAPVDCGAAPSVTNAGAPTIAGGAGGASTTTYGALASYTCNAGWARSGPQATCLSTGSWSAAPSCAIAEFVSSHGTTTAAQVPVAMVVDASENMYVALRFSGTPSDFGNNVKLTSQGNWDGAIVMFDKFGVAQWGVSVGGASGDGPAGLAMDSAGNLYLAMTSGSPTMTIDATHTVTGAGGYLISYTKAGVYRWSRALATGTTAVTVDASDRVTVAGTASGPYDFGGGPKTAKGPGDMFIASYDNANTYRWSNVYGTSQVTFGPPGNGVHTLSTDAAGNVYAGGVLGGPNGTVGGAGTLAFSGQGSAFIASYGPDGTHRWSKAFTASSTTGYADTQAQVSVADKLGNVAFGFMHRDVADYGGGPVTTGATGSEAGALVVFDAATGAYKRQRTFTMAPPFNVQSLGVDASNNFYLAGNSNNAGQDFGSGVLPSGAFVAVYGNDLSYQFARITGGGAYSYTFGFALGSSGDYLAVGSFDRGVVDWGAGSIPFPGTSSGNASTWVARMRPLPFSNGLSAHFSARDTTTVARNGANVVSSWTDTSGGARTLSPGATAPKFAAQGSGVKTLAGLDFAGGASAANASVPLTSTDVTFFVVVKDGTPTPAANWGVLASHGDRSADWSLEQNGTAPYNAHFKSNADNAGAQLACTPGSTYVLSGRISGTTRTFYRRDAAGTTTSTATGNTITTGSKALTFGASGTDASNAMVGEVVYFQRALSDAEVTQMINWLGTAWGI
jgi:hypothetical protein